MKNMTPIAQENLRKINEAGGVIALGTDQTIGPAVHREMELLVAAGIAPIDVIKIATHNAALFLGKEKEIGAVATGMRADLVLLDADPTASIDNAKRIGLPSSRTAKSLIARSSSRFDGNPIDCAPTEITVRNSFLRASIFRIQPGKR